MKLHFYSYRFADAVLDHDSFKDSKKEVLAILQGLTPTLLDPNELDSKNGGVKRRNRDKLHVKFLPVDQKRLNTALDGRFGATKGWELQPKITAPSTGKGPKTGLKGDYKKDRLQVEVQFGNMARWYTDVFKFQLSYSLDAIDVAILVVPTQRFANLIDENVACYERVCRELPWAKMSLTLPILVIGIEPTDYSGIKSCYDRAAKLYISDQAKHGKTFVAVPFDTAIAEEKTTDDEA